MYHNLRQSLDSDPGVSPSRRRGRTPSPTPRVHSPHAKSKYAVQNFTVLQALVISVNFMSFYVIFNCSRSPRRQTPWDRVTEHTDYTYGAAVERLKGMLHKHEAVPRDERKNLLFTPRGVGY